MSEYAEIQRELAGSHLTDAGLRWQPGRGARRTLTPGLAIAVALFTAAALLAALTLIR